MWPEVDSVVQSGKHPPDAGRITQSLSWRALTSDPLPSHINMDNFIAERVQPSQVWCCTKNALWAPFFRLNLLSILGESMLYMADPVVHTC